MAPAQGAREKHVRIVPAFCLRWLAKLRYCCAMSRRSGSGKLLKKRKPKGIRVRHGKPPQTPPQPATAAARPSAGASAKSGDAPLTERSPDARARDPIDSSSATEPPVASPTIRGAFHRFLALVTRFERLPARTRLVVLVAAALVGVGVIYAATNTRTQPASAIGSPTTQMPAMPSAGATLPDSALSASERAGTPSTGSAEPSTSISIGASAPSAPSDAAVASAPAARLSLALDAAPRPEVRPVVAPAPKPVAPKPVPKGASADNPY